MKIEKKSDRDHYRKFYRLTTRLMDNDINGHMNNGVYYSLLDTAICLWLDDNGIWNNQDQDYIAVAAETGCRYYSELAFPDIITAGLRIAKIGMTSVRYEIGLFRNQEHLTSAEGYFVHVYVNRYDRRPMALDERLKAKFKQIYIGVPV